MYPLLTLISAAGGGGGHFLGLPGRWSQFGEAAPSDSRDQQTYAASCNSVALSQPAVSGSLLWDQSTEHVLPRQDPTHAWQYSGGEALLLSCLIFNVYFIFYILLISRFYIAFWPVPPPLCHQVQTLNGLLVFRKKKLEDVFCFFCYIWRYGYVVEEWFPLCIQTCRMLTWWYNWLSSMYNINRLRQVLKLFSLISE